MTTSTSKNQAGLRSDRVKVYLLIFSSIVIILQFLAFEKKWIELYARVENWKEAKSVWSGKGSENLSELSPESDSIARKLGGFDLTTIEEKFKYLGACLSGKRFNGDKQVVLGNLELACLNNILDAQKQHCNHTQSIIVEALKEEATSLREQLSSLKQLPPSRSPSDKEMAMEPLQKELQLLQTDLVQAVTFVSLKDTSEAGSTDGDTNWFMSSLHGHPEHGKPEAFEFPSEDSDGRILCLQGNHSSDGTQNKYAFAPKRLLSPQNSVFLPGVTLIADNFWNYENIWHAITALANFAAWRMESGCILPHRLVLYHWGELVTSMAPWVRNVLHASLGRDLKVESLDYGGRPACFERAIVQRRGLGGASIQTLNKLFDMVRCRVRIFCKVQMEDFPSGTVNLLLLLRTGARAFKNESGVIAVVASRCERVAGCKLKVAHITTLSFCEQVMLLSRSDILLTTHGAQLTNMMFMSRGSSVMEMFPKGWLRFAGVGQYIYKWLTDWTGLHHEGAWYDTEGPDCPYPETEVLPCLLFHKDLTVGLNETHLSNWTADVLQSFQKRNSESKSKMKGNNTDGSECPCSQIDQVSSS